MKFINRKDELAKLRSHSNGLVAVFGRRRVGKTTLIEEYCKERRFVHTSLVKRETPFGESVRSTKRTLYSISDIALQCWFNVYSPHRSRWHLYPLEKRNLLIHQHSALVLESCYRECFLDGERYWEKGVEFDVVRYNPQELSALIVTELKHRTLSDADRIRIEYACRQRFQISRLSKKFSLARVEVLDTLEALRVIVGSAGGSA